MKNGTIWKFPLKHNTPVEIPANWIKLDVQVQGEAPTLWAMVDPAQPRLYYLVQQVGTGHPLPTGCGPESYVGTTQEGEFVWHWFLRRG